MIRTTLARTWVPALAAAVLAGSAAVAVPAAAQPAQPGPSAAQPAPAAPRAQDTIAHDPTVVREGDWYYMVITGDAGRANTYLPVKRSRDLVTWTELDPVFSSLPSWVLPTLGSAVNRPITDLWAPDLSYSNGEWRLYYAVSAAFGQNHSVIGLATTKTLDPASPDFGWRDQGLVVQSKPSPGDPQEFNAIDPDVTTDAQKRQWLSFGSFWTGLKMIRLDPATGKPSTEDTRTYDLVNRAYAPNAVEGPSIVRRGDFYYLFASFDYCCRGVDSDYRVVVGRSKSITGPYVDAEGVSLLEGGGTELLRGQNEFAGPGHGDVLEDRGRQYFVNHYYDTTTAGAPRLNVRPITWRNGWPVLGDPLNPSATAGHGSAFVEIASRATGEIVQTPDCGHEGANIGVGAPAPAGAAARCQQWQIDDRGNGSRILNRETNNVAEIAPCSQGGNVAQWGWVASFGPNDCQRWNFDTAADGWTAVRSVLPGQRAWTVDGSNLGIAAAATPTAAQQFRFTPVGEVLLGAATGGQSVLGVERCTGASQAHRDVEFQERTDNSCQEWRVEAVPGAATSTVTNVKSRLQLATEADGDLVLVRPTAANAASRAWTLAPTDEGTWTLANGTTREQVTLLRP
ncbi:hypothetical protein NUM3379_37470 [Kineococcus sp. NUM-3379]